jgi:hypothetical protein
LLKQVLAALSIMQEPVKITTDLYLAAPYLPCSTSDGNRPELIGPDTTLPTPCVATRMLKIARLDDGFSETAMLILGRIATNPNAKKP